MTIDKEAVRRQHRHVDWRSKPRNPIVILADNLDKAANLGGLLRTADGFLCDKVVTNRTEPDPGGAMGAEHWQPIEWGADLVAVAKELTSTGYSLVALEQRPDAVPIDQFRFPERTALAIGAEMFGVSDELLSLSDAVVFIPQAGLVKSLNVVVATAIALYEYSRQHWMREFAPSARHLEPAEASLRLETRHRVITRE